MFTLPRWLRPLIFLLGLLWLPLLGAASASRVSISPTGLALQPNTRAAQLTLTNQDTQPVTFDLSLLAWTQEHGQDVLGSTQAVVVAPATVTLGPGASQTVRLARLGAATLTELAYRLLITERPSPAAGVTTRLQFSVPLFDGPPAEATGSPGAPFLASRAPDGRLLLSNPGRSHLRLSTLEARGEQGWQPVPLLYLLAGQGRTLDLSGVQELRYSEDGQLHAVAIK